MLDHCIALQSKPNPACISLNTLRRTINSWSGPLRMTEQLLRLFCYQIQYIARDDISKWSFMQVLKPDHPPYLEHISPRPFRAESPRRRNQTATMSLSPIFRVQNRAIALDNKCCSHNALLKHGYVIDAALERENGQVTSLETAVGQQFGRAAARGGTVLQSVARKTGDQ
jgi:hypothetical protein